MIEENDAIHKYEPLWNSWRVEELIGKGSYGNVYKVYRELSGHRYISAVKMLTIPCKEQYEEDKVSLGNDNVTLRAYFEGITESILNQINLLYKLSGSTNVVGYFDHQIINRNDRFGWDILIRMEYVTSIPKYLESKQFSLCDVLWLGIDICKALELCEDEGVLHRNIKEDNIYISDKSSFKLGDFGISKELLDSGSTETKVSAEPYIAPEVWKGALKYDKTVDIYSLGIVLYKLLNFNRLPFLPSYPNEIKFKDRELAFERRMSGEVLSLPQQVSSTVGKIILKACYFEPKLRYESAKEFRTNLENLVLTLDSSELNKKVGIPLIPSEQVEEKEFSTHKNGSVGLMGNDSEIQNKEIEILDEVAATTQDKMLNKKSDSKKYLVEINQIKFEGIKNFVFKSIKWVAILVMILAILVVSFVMLIPNKKNTTHENSVLLNQSKILSKNLKPNDFLLFGKYNNEPIEWQVISNDKSVVTLISLYVITLKPFDAAESGKYGASESSSAIDSIETDILKYGSNSWNNSNLREWLNNSEIIVNFSTQSPVEEAIFEHLNSYDTEPGFLNNFSKKEIQSIIPFSYTENDKIYLPTSEVLKEIKNINSLRKKLSPKAVENSEFNADVLNTGCPYWLKLQNTGIDAKSDDSVMVMYPGGFISACHAANGNIGVVPVTNINYDVSFTKGSGTEMDPYAIN